MVVPRQKVKGRRSAAPSHTVTAIKQEASDYHAEHSGIVGGGTEGGDEWGGQGDSHDDYYSSAFNITAPPAKRKRASASHMRTPTQRPTQAGGGTAPGFSGGAPPGSKETTNSLIQRAVDLVNEGQLTASVAIKLFGIARSTFYKKLSDTKLAAGLGSGGQAATGEEFYPEQDYGPGTEQDYAEQQGEWGEYYN